MLITRSNRRPARQIAVASLLLACMLATTPGCQAAKDRRAKRRADRLEQRQQQQAQASQKNPFPTTSIKRADRSVNEGEKLYQAGNIDAALVEFERAIAINPELTTAYMRAGDIYREQKNFVKAESRYGQAAALEPRNFDAQYLHGLVLQLMNRLDESVRAYLRALAVRPNDFEANMNLGTAYLQLGEATQALPYSQRAVRINPESGPARVNLGAIYAELDRHDAAVIEYQQAAELLPTPDDKLLLNLADSLGRVQRYAEMSATLDQLVRIKPSAMAYERMGSALFRQRQYDQALSAFEQSLTYDDTHYPAHNGVAVCKLNKFLWSGKTDSGALNGAVSALRRSLTIERRQPKIIELLRRYGPAGSGG